MFLSSLKYPNSPAVQFVTYIYYCQSYRTFRLNSNIEFINYSTSAMCLCVSPRSPRFRFKCIIPRAIPPQG